MKEKRFLILVVMALLTIAACGGGAPSTVVLPIITSENAGSLTNINAKNKTGGAIIWLSDGSSIAMVGDREISILDTLTFQEEQHFTSASKLYQTLAISPTGDQVAIIVDDFTKVEIWNIDPPKLHMTLGDDEEIVFVNIATFSPDGNSLAMGGWGEDCAMVILWDLHTGKVIEKIAIDQVKPAYNRAIFNLAFSPDGAGWSAIACDGSLFVHYASMSFWTIGDGGKEQGAALAFSRDGDLLAVGGGSLAHNLRVYDISTIYPEVIFDLKEPKGIVKNVSFNADGSILAATLNGDVCLWDVNTGEQLSQLDIAAYSVAFSPDGTLLATIGMRDGLGMWAVAEP